MSVCLGMSAGFLSHALEEYRIELGAPTAHQEGRAYDFDASAGLAIAIGSWARLTPIEGGAL
jgi:hypothetical protein